MTRPMIMAMVVVLPAPLPTRSPVMEPRSRANEMPSTAVVVLYSFTSWSTAMTGSAVLDMSDVALREPTCGAEPRTRQEVSAAEPVAAIERCRRRLSRRGEGVHCCHDRSTCGGSPSDGAQRASRHAGAAALACGDRPDHRRAGGLFRARLRATDLGLPRGHRARRLAQRRAAHSLPDDAAADRKSTRLNSSHGSISYAVFCLKKK